MAILERPLLRPQQRFDLEDWEVLLSALRTDSKFWHSRFMASSAYIIQGFKIDSSFIGQSTAQITLDGSSLVNANNTNDFSWYTAELSPTPITIPSGSGGLQPGRNYVELVLGTQNGTPLQRAFWDPSANSGAGIEFTNEVNTVASINITAVVNQTSFNAADPDKVALAIIDVDGSFNINGIQDKRNLFFRLGNPDDSTADYAWGSREEPTTVLSFTSPAGTPYVAGETINFTSGASAEVVVGGTQDITARLFSNVNFNAGDTVVGATSGSSATLSTYFESFTGADKDIACFKDVLDALMSEIKGLKGTQFWFESGAAFSLPSVLDFVNTQITPIASGARFEWSGSNLTLTDDTTSGQATSDIMAAIRTMGKSNNVYLTRQDGQGGSASIGIADGSVLYVTLPDFAADRTFSEAGAGVTNFQVASRASFSPSDKNFVIAYREGNKLLVKGLGELEPGESIEVADQVSKGLLAFIGAASETDESPPYTTTPSADLSNQFSSGDSLTQAISINAANINDIVSSLIKPYYEPLTVTTAAAANDNEVQGPISAGTNLTLPLDSRDSNAVKEYTVGNGGLFVFRNGVMQRLDEDYTEVGASGALSDEIQIQQDLEVGETIEFKLVSPQIFGTASIAQPFFRNEILGQNGSQIPVGNLYNIGTNKLSVYRNGVIMNNTAIIGDAIDRYTEVNNNSVQLATAANSPDIFTMINKTYSPSITTITGVTGTALTVPSYGSNELISLFKNGVLQTTDLSAPAAMTYTEDSSTSVLLSTAATATDVFQVHISTTLPSHRTVFVGAGLTVISITPYAIGTDKLLVYRNGLLMYNSLVIGSATQRYQELNLGQIELEVVTAATDVIDIISLG